MNTGERGSFMKKFISISFILLLLFCLAQLIRPNLANPPVTMEVQVPDSVKAILRKGCYDCHSNQTDLKWFDKITPANFLVASHIRDGRKALNFSNWDSLNADAQKSILFWAVNDIRNQEMPLKSYLALHGSAKLDEHDALVLENYLSAITLPVTSQYAQPAVYKELSNVKDEWNGIRFIPGFEKWRAISITERFDNASLRVIYGNEIAVRAIADNHTNPWPDGTVFAKAAWKQSIDSMGQISRGSFWQVEFMIKDSKQYASTLGWGFGRWRGADLKPYGSDASFTGECVNCHRPLKNSDYTFTYPIKYPDSAYVNRHLIGEFVNARLRTMSIVFDDSAVATWSERPDPKWFGARIPDRLISLYAGKSRQ
jgi:hypothetical protein